MTAELSGRNKALSSGASRRRTDTGSCSAAPEGVGAEEISEKSEPKIKKLKKFLKPFGELPRLHKQNGENNPFITSIGHPIAQSDVLKKQYLLGGLLC